MWQQTVDGSASFALHLLLIKEERIVFPQFVPGKTRSIAGA
jgi:hypothetical protein